ALHVVPEQAGVLAAATKYLVPRILGEALYELSIILGARFYVREGEHAIFQNLTRDAPVLALGHAGAGAGLDRGGGGSRRPVLRRHRAPRAGAGAPDARDPAR